MRSERLASLSAIFLLAWLAAAAADKPDDKFNQYPFKQYPNTSAGLKDFFSDVIKYTREGRHIDVFGMSKELILPKHQEWFKAAFDDGDAQVLIKEYDLHLKDWQLSFVALVNRMVKNGWTDVVVSDRLTEHQEQAAKRMKNKVPLYSVRLLPPAKVGEKEEDRKGFHMYSFAYVDDHWRFLGSMRLPGAK